MRVFLDDQAVDGIPAVATPPEAVNICAEHAERQGRLVVGVVADGQPITHPESLAAAGELRLTTAEPARLLADAFEGTADLLTECRDLQTAAATALMEGRLEDGTRALQAVMECWNRVHAAVVQIERFARDRARQASSWAGLAEFSTMSTELAGTLRDLKNAIAAEDWSFAADVVGIDLQRDSERWRADLATRRDAALAMSKSG